MLIEKNLPQFRTEHALFIVAGQYAAKFYLAHNGTIEDSESFQIHKSAFSDKEGFSAKTTNRGLSVSGSNYEPEKEYLHKNFLKELVDKIKNIHEQTKFDSIYLFSPHFIENDIISSIPHEFNAMIRKKIDGNYVDKHPFELLKHLQAV